VQVLKVLKKDTATENIENRCFRPRLFSTEPPPIIHLHKTYITKNNTNNISAAYGSIFIQIFGLHKRVHFEIVRNGRSGSSKLGLLILAPIEIACVDFLLIIINGPVLHRFWDIAGFLLKSHFTLFQVITNDWFAINPRSALLFLRPTLALGA